MSSELDPRHLRSLASQLEAMSDGVHGRSPLASVLTESAAVLLMAAEELKRLRRQAKGPGS